jgi:hypothetical protein
MSVTPVCNGWGFKLVVMLQCPHWHFYKVKYFVGETLRTRKVSICKDGFFCTEAVDI